MSILRQNIGLLSKGRGPALNKPSQEAIGRDYMNAANQAMNAAFSDDLVNEWNFQLV